MPDLPAQPSAAFHDGRDWCVCTTPSRRWRVDAPDSTALSALAREATEALGGRDSGRLLTGMLAYDAGAAFHGAASVRRSAAPVAVLHLYEAEALTRLPALAPALPRDAARFHMTRPFQPDWQASDYAAAIARVQDYLRAGDCYQVNLAQRFVGRYQGSPWAGWQQLLAAHPAPHASYMDCGDMQVFGVSPERFLRIRGRTLLTEPIKGSRPRGQTPGEDQQLGEQLQQSLKDRAENLMIVDLLRNDLGQVAETGSIHASPLFELRRFSNVQHLVSSVHGRLREDISPLAALLACFPGGSITGAPKRRAMEIIAELEGAPRGFYCGSFFWQDARGHLDSTILIRTLQCQEGEIVCHGGGGIVHDSDPEQEYQESLFKVEKLMAALG
ncbi:aminodeoxychorismate synthase component I [Isoalcanivorax indicus]|uniref:aminodeoxychorismate synthase component I n=1 Tax=Isoalcanivorax indicus TaxID=2202653 RepID=UPI000DB98556|nr:aminodeoxychorismate synthase component I [Isoalcanivorax indicus]